MKYNIEIIKKVQNKLTKTFPNTKFDIKFKNYKMGCGVNINWINGISKSKVVEIIKKYEDIYLDPTNEITTGGNTFIFCRRDISNDVYQNIYNNILNESYSDGKSIDKTIRELLYSIDL